MQYLFFHIQFVNSAVNKVIYSFDYQESINLMMLEKLFLATLLYNRQLSYGLK